MSEKLPILAEINHQKEMANNYKHMEDIDDGVTEKLENLGIEKSYFLEKINKYIDFCKNKKCRVYGTAITPLNILDLHGFRDYFKESEPDEKSAERNKFIEILNEIFITKDFTDKTRTISKETPQTEGQSQISASKIETTLPDDYFKKRAAEKAGLHIEKTQTPE